MFLAFPFVVWVASVFVEDAIVDLERREATNRKRSFLKVNQLAFKIPIRFNSWSRAVSKLLLF